LENSKDKLIDEKKKVFLLLYDFIEL